MTSVLNVDTIADKAGTGPVALTKQEGSKSRGHFEGSDATLDGSFNTASLTDNATGKFTPNFTNSMTDGNYSVATNNTGTSNTASNSGNKAQTYTTSNFQIVTTENGADSDEDDTIYIVVGDLA
jgi:hypothetical protein